MARSSTKPYPALLRRYLSKVQCELLAEMAAQELSENYEDAEIVCDGAQCWLGFRRVGAKTVTQLLLAMVVSEHLEAGAVRRYTLNGSGRAALENPDILIKLQHAVRTGESLHV